MEESDNEEKRKNEMKDFVVDDIEDLKEEQWELGE